MVPAAGSLQTVYSTTDKLYYDSTLGNLYATNFVSLSDIRSKKEVSTIENALATVNNLRGVNFKWVTTDQPAVGVISQEVEEVVPEVVYTSPTGDKCVAYGNLLGILIEAIKELDLKVSRLG